MFLFAFLDVCIHIACCFVATTISGERPPKRAKFQTEEQDLCEQPPLATKGQYVTVKQMCIAGFSSGESLLYVREETVDLWNALNSTTDDSNNLAVDGPPGTGKSTEVWAWALWKAREDKLKITWYHMTKRTMEKVLIDGATNKITTGYTAERNDIKDSEGSILIVDGVISSMNVDVSNACHYWRKGMRGRSYILVSSVSVNVALQENSEARIVVFNVGSWTFEQYQKACEYNEFFTLVAENMRCPGIGADADKHKLLLSKYYFAGGCARWMFEFTYDASITDINAHLEKVGDYHSLWRSGGGDETIVAVNHLRGLTVVVDGKIWAKKYFFISQYVAAVLAATCSDRHKFLVESYKISAATKNPSFEGWIFEFDVDYQLSPACSRKEKFRAKMRPQTDDAVFVDEDRTVDMYEVFNSDDELSDKIKLLDANRMLWAKPQSWCQKAYDFLCVWKDDSNALKMVVANATLAKTHSVLLTEVNNLASALGVRDCVISAIRFDFIVPENADFTIGDISGRLCDWDNLIGKKWPNKSSSEAYTDCLSVIEVARTS